MKERKTASDASLSTPTPMPVSSAFAAPLTEESACSFASSAVPLPTPSSLAQPSALSAA